MSARASGSCIVSGATGGNPAAITEGLARMGHRVMVVGRPSPAGLDRAQAQPTADGSGVRFEPADLPSLADVERLARRFAA